MPEIIETTVYRLDELSDAAKDKARAWYREGGFDYDWYDAVYEDFQRVADILGLRLKTRATRLYGGRTRPQTCIWFRGFWNQGDGACFETFYSYRKEATRRIREYAPQDTTLHGIADARGLLWQSLRSRVEIALPRGLLPRRARLFHLLHRHEIAHFVDAAAIRQDGWRPARLIHYRAADLDLRACKGSDVRWRQREHGLQADDAEHEEEQQDGQSTERALAPEQNER